MVSSGRFSLAEVELETAFHQSGCPVCRLKQEAAYRYIRNLLWENVNDITTRIHLARSLGFCPQHTWYMYHAEMNGFCDWLGFAIIHKDLTQLVATRLHDFGARLASNGAEQAPWWQRVWAGVRHALNRASSTAAALGMEVVSPNEPCRACFYAENSERNNIGWLIEGLCDDAFRRRYAASDGLCLIHLRQTLQRAARTQCHVARFLVEDAATRLAALTADLGEYARKQAWQHRHETVTTSEQESPRRAAQFFGGLDRDRRI